MYIHVEWFCATYVIPCANLQLWRPGSWGDLITFFPGLVDKMSACATEVKMLRMIPTRKSERIAIRIGICKFRDQHECPRRVMSIQTIHKSGKRLGNNLTIEANIIN